MKPLLICVLVAMILSACGQAPAATAPAQTEAQVCLPPCFSVDGKTERMECFSNCVAPGVAKVR